MIFIKNISGLQKTIRGHVVAVNGYVEIPEAERPYWSNDNTLLDDIIADNLLVAKSSDGLNDITDHSLQLNVLYNNLPSNVIITGSSPFASKVLAGGEKLYRRKHGKKETILANSEKEIIFTVPYSHAKINKLEIVHANGLDRVDLLIKSPVDATVAALYGMPANYLLNQFAFDVVVCELIYSDKSDYDADLYMGFQVVVLYKNDTALDTEVGFNLIYHEVV